MRLFFCFNFNKNFYNFYTKLNSILIVNILVISVVLQLNSILVVESKCAMRAPCTPRNEIGVNDDPFSQKWYNCYTESSEPEALLSRQSIDDFKRLCSPMYENDAQPLCCNEEQLTILKQDLLAAEAVIGSCPSCYLNFRMLWCHMTCSPNQSDFIIPKIIELKDRVNFTKLYNEHKQFKHFKKDHKNDDDDDDNADTDDDDDDNKQNKNDHTDQAEQLNHQETNDHSDSLKLLERRKRNIDDTKSLAVIEIEYYISEDFLLNLIKSCRDVKLYGDDAIVSICGLNSKYCTPQKMMDYLGLIVPERPFNIRVKLTNETEFFLKNVTINNQGIEEVRDLKIRPVKPKYHLCNETYQYGDFDYGAKCSCKACKDSCELYDEFRIVKRRADFKVGKLDGAAFIMMIIFALFVVAFFQSIHFYRRHRRSNDRDAIYRKHTSLSVTTQNLFTRLFRFVSVSRMKRKESIQHNNDINLEKQLDNYVLTPVEDNNFEENNEILFSKRESQLNFLDKMKYFGENLEAFIEDKFTRLGRFCAIYPGVVLTIGLAFCAIMCLGYFNFKVEKDPVKLWSAETSIARQNKKYFDENFNPFYRITQLIIEPKPIVEPVYFEQEKANLTVFQKRVLEEALNLYDKINSIQAICDNCEEVEHVRLEDICYQPLWPENTNCATQAIFQYWQNDIQKIKDSLASNEPDSSPQSHLLFCMKNPYAGNCLSAFGGPIHSYMVAGSYNDDNYLNANALVITYVIKNYKKTNIDPIKKAMAWESEVLKLLQNYSSSLIDISYTTERSIEDELERESKADIKIIAISYLMMFVYLTATLGKYSSLNLRVILLEMKIFLGLAGVTLVLLSVFSSGGFFTYLGVPATLITLEVIPFLLLAVGVDNIYVMVQTYQNDERQINETVQDQIARIVGKVGPSMLLTGTTQSAAFLISAMTPMPGVRAFSLYASLAIILNFLMQITCFVALLTLDARREKSKRVDILCCIKLNINDSQINTHLKSFLHRYFKNIYTPFLFNDCIRACVIIIFVGFFFSCISMCDKIKIGLDQKLAMPSDSYQIKYFEGLQKHLKVGPPVYFVLKDGYNYSDTNLLRLLCGSSNCDANSLQSIISAASMYPNETYIAQSTVNWIDDYMEWLSANSEATTSSTCCYINSKTNNYCDVKKYPDSSDDCIPCHVNRTIYDFPTNESLHRYLDIFLNQNPSETCVKAGHAMYGNAVKTKLDEHHHVKHIKSSHFMAYHTVLSSSDDFINAMISANQISDLINKILNNHSMSMNNNTELKYEVIPYSIFYVFYEQYIKIWQDATAQLILTLVAIFLCTFILLSFDLFTSLIVTGVIAIIIIDMVGIMYLWNIELNAISLVNLVIAIGISVEFSSHIARAFATSDAKDKKERAAEALCSMGPPVFSGVLQSIVGISVLAFAHSQLFQVFYFRMYFSILVLGLTHGLIFLPVLLSYIGRSSSKIQYSKVNRQHINNGQKEIGQENIEIDDLDLNDLNMNNSNNMNTQNKIDLNGEIIDRNSAILLNETTDSENWRKSNLSVSSPTKKQIKTNNQSCKFYSKKSLTNSNNNDKSNDRDSPTSKKSVDLLLNDQNSHENMSSDSSNASTSLNDTPNNCSTDQSNSESNNKEHKSIKHKLNSFNIFKLNKQVKQNGKFQKMTTSNNREEDEYLKSPSYKQIKITNVNKIEIKQKDLISSKNELDSLKQSPQLITKTPNLSIKSDTNGKTNGTLNSTKIINSDILSQPFNLNRNLLNSNTTRTGLIDKMNDKLANFVPLTNSTHNDAIINN